MILEGEVSIWQRIDPSNASLPCDVFDAFKDEIVVEAAVSVVLDVVEEESPEVVAVAVVSLSEATAVVVVFVGSSLASRMATVSISRAS